ncbi:Uncharacterised protein [Clostridioides difficile]|nr:Uncharacterised protein [Clostridioides difficile]
MIEELRFRLTIRNVNNGEEESIAITKGFRLTIRNVNYLVDVQPYSAEKWF